MKKKKEAAAGVATERRSPRQQRSQATVEAILSGAAKVLASDGFDGINTNRIAEVAGISVGSLYQYFKNKDDVIQALIEQQGHLITSLIQGKLIRLAGLSLREVVHGLIEAFLQVQKADSSFFRVVREGIPRNSKFSRIDQVQRSLVELLTASLGSPTTTATVRDPRMAAFLIVHAIDGIIDSALRQNLIETDYDLLLEETTKLVMSYLSGPSPKSGQDPALGAG